MILLGVNDNQLNRQLSYGLHIPSHTLSCPITTHTNFPKISQKFAKTLIALLPLTQLVKNKKLFQILGNFQSPITTHTIKKPDNFSNVCIGLRNMFNSIQLTSVLLQFLSNSLTKHIFFFDDQQLRTLVDHSFPTQIFCRNPP